MYISRISQPSSKNQIKMIWQVGLCIADVFTIFIFYLIQELLSHGSMVYSGLATGLESLSCFLQQLYGDWCVQGLQCSTYLENQQRQLQVRQACISGTYQHVSIEMHCIYSHIILFTSGLAYSPQVQQIVNLSGSLVKPKTIKLVFAASLLSLVELRNKGKDRLAHNQDNVSEWIDMNMSIRRLWFQLAHTKPAFLVGFLQYCTMPIKMLTKHVGLVQSGHHHLRESNLFSHDSQ